MLVSFLLLVCFRSLLDSSSLCVEAFVVQSSFCLAPPMLLSSSLSPTLRPTMPATRQQHRHKRPPKMVYSFARKSCTRLILTAKDFDNPVSRTIVQRAVDKFKARPATYLLIPCVAAMVGWVTNWMAVQMIFYPIKFRGVPLYRRKEVPLGLIGWQGIVPCKTRPMSEAMVDMVTSELLTVKEAFGRLEPRKVAQILAPEVPKLTTEILQELIPLKWMAQVPSALYWGLDNASQAVIKHFTKDFLIDLTKSMQQNIDSIFDLKRCVVSQMMQDRTMLGKLFVKCGQKEFDFLTNSGLWFGFLLGIIQMFVALFWDNPWSLSIGGAIVGFATNWLALKWIFEPVDPLRIGPITLQGQFLRRQKEVAKEFSDFFANNILTSEKLWNSVLNDPETRPAFAAMFAQHFKGFVNKITRGFRFAIEPETVDAATSKALQKLPNHLPVLYPYMDRTLGLEDTLRVRMEKMSSRKFERVLHPIFEEDELTLIIAGAALGFAAGLVQQGLETGKIKISMPNIPKLWHPVWTGIGAFVVSPKNQTQVILTDVRGFGGRSVRRIRAFPARLASTVPISRFLSWSKTGSANEPSSPSASDDDETEGDGNSSSQ